MHLAPLRRIFLLLQLLLPIAAAEVKLPALFGDNMVLQCDLPAKIWGAASPGEKVVVAIFQDGKVIASVHASADDAGRWRVQLPAQPAGGPFELNVAGANSLALKNVMFGEVWICSGQSNMGMHVESALNSKVEIANAKYPDIRLFDVKTCTADHPLTDVHAAWQPCSPEAIKTFSATAYFFGRKIYLDRKVPIGLIHSCFAGTVAEAWMSPSGLQSDPAFKPILDHWDKLLVNYPKSVEFYKRWLEQWRKDANEAKSKGLPAPKKRFPPIGPGDQNRPSNLYNAMVAPLIPLTIRGVIWYQGEYNCSRAYQYRKLFPALIRDWRANWGQGDFPFLFVQLANVSAPQTQPGESSWAELREAQTMALSTPGTAMAVTIDTGDTHLHPQDKQDCGMRLALAALATVYGEKIEYSGPMYAGMSIEDNKIRLKFTHVGTGLTTKKGEALKGFTLAGENHKFVWADAQIDGDSILVSSAAVEHPVSVRYGWADNPPCNLYNKEGLPASPFRTDTWPGITDKNDHP